jgi:hypothetical protein
VAGLGQSLICPQGRHRLLRAAWRPCSRGPALRAATVATAPARGGSRRAPPCIPEQEAVVMPSPLAVSQPHPTGAPRPISGQDEDRQGSRSRPPPSPVRRAASQQLDGSSDRAWFRAGQARCGEPGARRGDCL